MTSPHLADGSILRLHHGGPEIARLTVTGTEMFRVYADAETLPGFEPFRALFAEQERAAEEGDGTGPTPATSRSAAHPP